ncbi:DNA cytosine methyltransferase [Streptomyces sp. SID10815]|uniref:DNA cytosine methyltransferase n=1 Tax=Streptomyces sp. SID10815 TaxID=2706027 RepID=UPI001EF1D0D6|nr:DNA cytosine methyltransferase [Streptomyces sp. SID10815]
MAGDLLGGPSLGIEWDRRACLTRYAAGMATLHAYVSAIRGESLDSLPPEINVLAGGPPCRTYSVAGRGSGCKAWEEVKSCIRRIMAGEAGASAAKVAKEPEPGAPTSRCHRLGAGPHRRSVMGGAPR